MIGGKCRSKRLKKKKIKIDMAIGQMMQYIIQYPQDNLTAKQKKFCERYFINPIISFVPRSRHDDKIRGKGWFVAWK